MRKYKKIKKCRNLLSTLFQTINLKFQNERGVERIRTAVQGFADLCLATRPRRPILGMQI